jgi:hypothetical protein
MSESKTPAGTPAAREQTATTRPPSARSPLPEGELAAYAWMRERSKRDKLLQAKKRRALAEGLTPGVLVFGWGISVTAWDEAYSVRWEEITRLYKDLTRRNYRAGLRWTYLMVYKYTLELAGGQSKSLFGMLEERLDQSSRAARVVYTPGVTTPVTVEQFGRLLDQEVSRVQLPLAVNRFNTGEPVAFGPLTVTRNSIDVGDESAPWSEIDRVQTKQGRVSVWKPAMKRPWKTVAVSKIPNFSVFAALADAAMARRPSASAP